MRDIIGRIFFLRRRFGPRTRIVLSKMDVTEAFRQVRVQWTGAPVFGYVFRDFVVADRRLQFGWRSSPGFFCLFSAALEHAHRHTSYGDAVVMAQGRAATGHVSVIPPRTTDRPALLPPGCRIPRGRGGVKTSPFFRTILCRRRDLGGGTMVARWPALSTRVRVSGVGPLSALWGEILTGSHPLGSA